MPEPKRQKCNTLACDPLPLTETDIDVLSDLTNGNCGIVALMRIPRPILNGEFYEGSVLPAAEISVETSEHVDMPPTVEDVKENDFERLVQALKVTLKQQMLVQEATKNQSSNEKWFAYRKGRITASIFKDAVHKVNDNLTVINRHKSKSIIAKVCGYNSYFESKATQWGVANEPVARNLYRNSNMTKHSNFIVTEPGFFIDINFPFIGASPDGLINCSCHDPGVLEIKCPWSARDLTIKEYAISKQSCLEVTDGVTHLKKNHQYFYQVQCQMMCTKLGWCDFFLYTTKDNFTERIYYDQDFMEGSMGKATITYKELIFPEI